MSEISIPQPKEVLAPQSWREWYKASVEKKGKEVKDVPVENDDWRAEKDASGKIIELKHKENLFFKVVGKDAGWKQPLLETVFDPEDPKKRQGMVVLMIDKKTGDMLLNTEFEIGGKGEKHVSIRPTIQGSYSNIKTNGYPFAERFNAKNILGLEEKMKLQGGVVRDEQTDPGRMDSCNLYGILPVDRDSVALADKPFHRWVNQSELNEIRTEGNLLTSLFSVVNEMRLNWMMEQNIGQPLKPNTPIQSPQPQTVPQQKAA